MFTTLLVAVLVGTSMAMFDEYGNLLDENGLPISQDYNPMYVREVAPQAPLPPPISASKIVDLDNPGAAPTYTAEGRVFGSLAELNNYFGTRFGEGDLEISYGSRERGNSSPGFLSEMLSSGVDFAKEVVTNPALGAALVANVAPAVASYAGVSQPVATAGINAGKAYLTGENPLQAAAMSYGTAQAMQALSSLLGVPVPAEYSKGLEEMYGAPTFSPRSPLLQYASAGGTTDVPIQWDGSPMPEGYSQSGYDDTLLPRPMPVGYSPSGYEDFGVPGAPAGTGPLANVYGAPPGAGADWYKWALGGGALGAAALGLGGNYSQSGYEDTPVPGAPSPNKSYIDPLTGLKQDVYGSSQSILDAVRKGLLPASAAIGLLGGDSSALSKILAGTATMDDWLKLAGQVGPSLLGAVGSMRQTDKLADLAQKYIDMGKPYRDRLEESYRNPEAFLSSPEFTTPVQLGTDAMARALSAKVGNPVTNPGALSEIQNYATKSLAGNAANERQRLANFGGLSAFTAAAPGLERATIGSDANLFNVAGAGLGEVLNPPQDNSLAAMLKKLGGDNIFGVQ